MPFPVDVAVFAGTVVVLFAAGIPVILRSVTVPVDLEIEEVPDGDLTPEQLGLFRQRDAELAELGFYPVRTACVVNMQGGNLVRTYLGPSAWELVNLNLMRAAPGGAATASMEVLEVTTVYSDGALTITRNAEIDDVLDFLPDQVVADERGVTSAEVLLQRHRGRTDGVTNRSPLQLRREQTDDRWRDHHRRWAAHNVDRGLLRLDSEAEVYRPTVRTALRGIANYLNPFADDFTLRRGAAALVFGLVAPIGILLYLKTGTPAPMEGFGDRLGVDPRWVFAAVGAMALGVSGAVIGRLFSTKTMIWSFLLAYVPLRLIGGVWWLALALSLWSSAVADIVGRRRADRAAPI